VEDELAFLQVKSEGVDEVVVDYGAPDQAVSVEATRAPVMRLLHRRAPAA